MSVDVGPVRTPGGSCAAVAPALAVGNKAAEVCGVVGDLEVETRERRAGTPRARLAASDTVDTTLPVPRPRETTLTLQRTATDFGSRPSDRYFRSVCLSVCLFVESFSQPSLI